MYEDYVSERINGDVSLWAPVKKENKMFLSGNKTITVKLRHNTVDLQETKDLFARWYLPGQAETSTRKRPYRKL